MIRLQYKICFGERTEIVGLWSAEYVPMYSFVPKSIVRERWSVFISRKNGEKNVLLNRLCSREMR